MFNVLHPDRRVVKNLRILGNQLSRHDRNILCRRKMIVGIRQSAAILKMCVLHAEAFRLIVHQLDKLSFASRYVLRHRHTGVIAAGHRNTLNHGLKGLRLPLFQKNLRSSHGFCVCACCHLILQMNPAAFQVFKDNEQRHDLCNACRTAPRVRILLADDLPRGGLHHNIRRRFHLRRCMHRNSQCQKQRVCQQNSHQKPHNDPLLYFPQTKSPLPIVLYYTYCSGTTDIPCLCV